MVKLGKRRYPKKKMMLKRYKAPSLMGKVINRKIEISLPINFVTQTASTGYYTFGTSITLPTYQVSAFQSALLRDEYQETAAAYNFVKIKGASLQYFRTLNAAVNTVYQLPQISFDIIPQQTFGTSVVTKNTAVDSETSYTIQPLQTDMQPRPKYYSFPPIIVGNGGRMVGGTGLWMNCSGIDSTYTDWYAILGHIDPPLTSNATDIVKIGSLKVSFYLSFAKGIKLR